MKPKMHQLQKAADAANIIRQYGVAYLAMETRTGKTITAFEAAKILNKKHILFITKKKAIPSILADYQRAGYDQFFEAKVVNYEMLHSKEIRGFDCDLKIVDEAHRLGAYPRPCVAAHIIHDTLSETDAILMSATPCPESWSQIFHQFWALRKYPFDGIYSFYRFVDAGYVKKSQMRIPTGMVTDYSHAIFEKINPKIRHLFVHCSRDEAGITTAVSDRILRVPVSRYIMGLFNLLVKDRILYIGNETVTGDTAAKLLSKSHQLISGTVIFDSGKSMVIDYSKAYAIKDDAARNGYSRIVIFYKFKAEEQAIRKVFGDENVTGSWQKFQAGGYQVFASQFLSGREGIRADKASAVYLYNIDFAWLSYAQARERIISMDRLDNPELVFVMASYPDGKGLEDRIYRVVMNKKKYTYAFFRRDFLC